MKAKATFKFDNLNLLLPLGEYESTLYSRFRWLLFTIIHDLSAYS